jgi:AcrR family transcriptional regulator
VSSFSSVAVDWEADAEGPVARERWHYDGDLRRDLIERAVTHVADEGTASLSLRGLARELGVSHAAPAAHFRDKAEVFAAIASDGFAALGAAFDAAWADTADLPPGSRIAAVGRAYLEVALANPGHYAVMFRPDLCASPTGEGVETHDVFGRFERYVGAAQAEGWSSDEPTRDVTIALWSFVHGLTELVRSGALATATGDTEQVPALVEQLPALLERRFA